MRVHLRRHFQFGLIFKKIELYNCPSTFYFRLKSSGTVIWFIFWGWDYPTFLTDKGGFSFFHFNFWPLPRHLKISRSPASYRFWHIFGFEIFRIKPLNHNRNFWNRSCRILSKSFILREMHWWLAKNRPISG